MGAFFTNIQFKTTGFDNAKITQEVIEFITNYSLNAGFIQVDNEDDADKTIIVSNSADSDWLSIYDEEMEDQGSKSLNLLSAALSKQFGSHTLSVLVNDSDSLYIGLHNRGTLKDAFSNLSKTIDFTKRKPIVWSEILVNNYTFDDIQNAWQNKTILVEDFLAEFAKFINIDTSKLITGFNYFNEENSNEGIKLNFARKDQPPKPKLELTKFGLLGGSGLVDVSEGERQTIHWILTNYGTFSKGIEVMITGECIEKGLLVPESVHASYFRPHGDQQKEYEVPFEELVTSTGEKIYCARFEDMYIRKGFQTHQPMSPKEQKRYFANSYACAMKFDIRFIGGKNESGEFDLFFVPLENRQEGAFYYKMSKGSLNEWIEKMSND